MPHVNILAINIKTGDYPKNEMSTPAATAEQLLDAGFQEAIAITPPHQPLAEAILPDQARLNLRCAVKKLSFIL